MEDKVAHRKAQTDKVCRELLDITGPIRKQLMVKVREAVKENALCDPDMWQCLRSGLGAAVDQMMDDVDKELERSLVAAMMVTKTVEDGTGPKSTCLTWGWCKFRAFVLHHYLPHDLYIFSKLKDPAYLLMTFLLFLPIHGFRVVLYALLLLMIAFPSPPDEYNIINFIVLCKGLQFLTSGVMQTFSASLSYYYCYSMHKDDLLACNDTHGPGSLGKGLAIDYLGSIILVWIAFFFLKRSKRHGDQSKKGRDTDKAYVRSERRRHEEAGGRFRSLLAYDMKCFAITVLLLGGLTVLTCKDSWLYDGTRDSALESVSALVESPQFSANIFWCCVLYSMLSAPFFPFIIPTLQTMLCHCDPTGYNENGACVTFIDPAAEEKREADTQVQEAEIGKKRMQVAKFATNFIQLMNEGREARGVTAEADAFDFQVGDAARGLFARWRPGRKPSSPLAEQGEGVEATPGKPKASFTFFGKKPRTDSNSNAVSEEDEGQNEESAGVQKGPGASKEQLDFETAVSEALGKPISVVNLQVQQPFKTKDGVTLFQVDAMERTRDSKGAERFEPITTVHRFSAFKHLSQALGQRCLEFPDAPFPPYYMIPATKTKLEERRAGLEAWLQMVMQDLEVTVEGGEWTAAVHLFLSPSKYAALSAEVPGVTPAA